MGKDTTIVIRGKLDWAKVVGKARPYTGDKKFDKGPLWSIDITPDKASLAKIKAAGIEGKLRTAKGKDTRTEKFLSLTILETKADGSKNNPPVVKDASGEAWPDGVLIGNGSVGDIMVKVKDYGTTIGAYYQKMRVLDHVSFGGDDFEPLSEDDKFFGNTAKATAGSVGEAEGDEDDSGEDLDEIPF